jgi:hypothetical protein
MYPEPTVPFYMALSVYVPLIILAYFAVYLTLRLFVFAVERLAARWNARGRDTLGKHGMHLPHAPAGRA